MTPKIIAIDGNIGAGKSTFLDELQTKYISRNDIIILKEPVDKWTSIKDMNNESVLEKFYQNPQKYGFMFQVMVFQTILDDLKNAIDNPLCKFIICERSIASALNIFMKMLYDDQVINAIEFKIYNNFYTRYVKETFFPDIIYYLDIPCSICYERIIQRNRPGEEDIDMRYLEQCEKYYNDWFNKEKNIKIIRLTNPNVDDIIL